MGHENESLHKVAVISNTYDILRQDAIDIIIKCDAVIHAGNFVEHSTYQRIKNITPRLYSVRGNDDGSWASRFGHVLEFDLFRHRFFLVHDKKRTPADNAAEVVIYGNSNSFEAKKISGRLIINPGNGGRRNLIFSPTMAVLTVGRKHIAYEKIVLKGEAVEKTAETASEITADLIKKICGDVDTGTDLSAIARIYNISSELTAQIARIYVTHPGVSPEDILAKMGI